MSFDVVTMQIVLKKLFFSKTFSCGPDGDKLFFLSESNMIFIDKYEFLFFTADYFFFSGVVGSCKIVGVKGI